MGALIWPLPLAGTWVKGGYLFPSHQVLQDPPAPCSEPIIWDPFCDDISHPPWGEVCVQKQETHHVHHCQKELG